MHADMNILMILWESGVVVKLVLLLLIAASVLSWAIILNKKKTFQEVEESNERFSEFFRNNESLAEVFSRSREYEESSLSTMFQSGYHELGKIREKLTETGNLEEFQEYFRQNGIHAMERSLKQGVNVSNQKLENRLSMLASIGSVSPFIGLFGTVWGIIDSFTGLASGGGSIEAVAPGIAEALVATAVGLFAAIPAVWAFNIFNNRMAKINTDMENFGQDFLNTVERNVLIKQQ
jgi:biopolymer transport protein TolQ